MYLIVFPVCFCFRVCLCVYAFVCVDCSIYIFIEVLGKKSGSYVVQSTPFIPSSLQVAPHGLHPLIQPSQSLSPGPCETIAVSRLQVAACGKEGAKFA